MIDTYEYRLFLINSHDLLCVCQIGHVFFFFFYIFLFSLTGLFILSSLIKLFIYSFIDVFLHVYVYVEMQFVGK